MTSRLLSGPARLTVAIALTIERLDRGDAESTGCASPGARAAQAGSMSKTGTGDA